MPSSHATSIMFSAAWPRSNRIESGASGRCGSGVTRAIPTAAPARWPAHGPTVESARRRSRSRQTMKAQRCWFFEEPARRPALRIRSRCAASSGRSANARIARRVAIARPDRVVRRRSGSRGSVAGGARLGARDRLRRARQGDLGERPEAARAVLDGAEALLGVRDPFGRDGGSASPAASGRERAAERARRERRHGPPVRRELVQPRVLAALDERASRSACRGVGRQARATGRAAAASRARCETRHDGVVRRRGRAGSGRGSGRSPPPR